MRAGPGSPSARAQPLSQQLQHQLRRRGGGKQQLLHCRAGSWQIIELRDVRLSRAALLGPVDYLGPPHRTLAPALPAICSKSGMFALPVDLMATPLSKMPMARGRAQRGCSWG